MSHYKYLIVGGGMTSDAAVRGIRDVDPAGGIGIVGAEIDPPYKRPPLSKGLWKGDPPESIWYGTESRGAKLHLGQTARNLDLPNRRLVTGRGDVFTFDKLLLATGGTPRRFSFNDEKVVHYRTVADYHRLRAMAEQGRRFAVIGGGFIGSEIAAALAMNGKEVVMIFPGEAVCARLFPQDLSTFLNGYYRQKGVELLPGTSVVDVETVRERLALKLQGATSPAGWEIQVDGVVAGIGIEPNMELARGAGLGVDDGILVDERLRTGHPDVFAAGDVASFHSPALGKRLRVEHEDNAKMMGRAAGRAMAGQSEPYRHLPFFYSDLFELGYEAVGELDPRLEILTDWREPNHKGVIYYLQEGKVRGVLLWNVWEQVEAARKLIAEPGPFRPEDLKGRL
jgi:NADPH-dependent 2,4-dienoyl-CoA reductase/sulfur reductase-like enzyme